MGRNFVFVFGTTGEEFVDVPSHEEAKKNKGTDASKRDQGLHVHTPTLCVVFVGTNNKRFGVDVED